MSTDTDLLAGAVCEHATSRMHIPEALLTLLDDGVITDVIRPLKSGKEASVHLVRSEGRICAAKVYKRLEQRNFRDRADYTEGRKVGDSRQQRAMDKGSRFGRAKNEAAWQVHEADVLRKLHAAGVRVPAVHQLCDGVLLMDLVTDARGEPAPTLATLRYERRDALRDFQILIRETARMLICGLIHGDLSEHNILLAADGPVIIDVPQAIDAARNGNAKRLLLRDVNNLVRFFGRWAGELKRTDYGNEIWLHYQAGSLTPTTPLTGRVQAARQQADAAIVLREIENAKRDAAKREEIRQARATGQRKR